MCKNFLDFPKVIQSLKVNRTNLISFVYCFTKLDENWLNSVFYSLSPTGELLIIGHGSKFILLTSRWNNEQTIYSYTLKGELENPNDIITSLICLPIVGTSNVQVRISNFFLNYWEPTIIGQFKLKNSPEWTCIAIGLSSGHALFYTDSGIELFSQQWHNEPIHAIKAQSGKKINEEIHIFYLSCACIIQGSHLFTLLRTMKSHLQRCWFCLLISGLVVIDGIIFQPNWVTWIYRRLKKFYHVENGVTVANMW